MDENKEEVVKPAEESKRIDKPVIKNEVVVKKTSGAKKFYDIFIAEDARKVKDYLLLDVVIPGIKDAIEDIITKGVRMLLRGETSARGSDRGPTHRISYNNMYSSRDGRDRFSDSAPRTPSYSQYYFDEIIFKTKAEAQDVLDCLDNIMEQYDGVVRLADYYDLAGITGNHTDNEYGWTNLSTAEVVRTRDGWTIKLPKVAPIKK